MQWIAVKVLLFRLYSTPGKTFGRRSWLALFLALATQCTLADVDLEREAAVAGALTSLENLHADNPQPMSVR
jgi:hypothetical protein